MKTIQLTQGQVALVDDEDYDMLMQYKWCAARDGNTFYAVSGRNPQIRMHNLIMNTKGVDHKDRNGLNNQKNNLRIATHSQNHYNKCGYGESGYKGVSWSKGAGKWRATICVNGKTKHLGYFDSKIEAAIAYNIAAKEYFGEFALLNVF